MVKIKRRNDDGSITTLAAVDVVDGELKIVRRRGSVVQVEGLRRSLEDGIADPRVGSGRAVLKPVDGERFLKMLPIALWGSYLWAEA